MDTKTVVGGWTEFDFTISADAKEILHSITSKLMGVNYVAVAVATQPVAGTNYCFLCEATGVYPGACTSLVEIYIYRPLKGDAQLTAITPVMECHPIPGGWFGFHDVSPAEKEVLTSALNGLLGVKYDPLQVATQVVSGTNYCFLCKATVLSPSATPHPVLIRVYQPLSGKPHISSIAPIAIMH
jgi:hypothetical protein